MEISFNPDYMKAALRAFGDTSITIRFISAIRPFTLEPTESQGSFYSIDYTSPHKLEFFHVYCKCMKQTSENTKIV